MTPDDSSGQTMTPDDSTRCQELSGGLSRRRFLGAVGATAAVGSAGCLGGDTDRPEYTKWLPAGDGATFAVIEFDVVAETGGEGPGLLPFLFPVPDDDERRPVELPNDELIDSEDPLLATPFEVTGAVVAGAFFGLWSAGLSYLADREESAATDTVLLVDGVAVATGSFDTARVGERLRASPDREFGGDPYEQVDETGRFVYYQAVDSESVFERVAVSEEWILLAESRSEIRRIAETRDGDRARAVDAVDGFDRLVETAGDGQVVAGWHGTLNETLLLGYPDDWAIWELLAPGETGFVTSARLDPDEDGLTADIATRGEALGSNSTSRLREQFGNQSRDSTVTLVDEQLSVSGTYGEIPFTPVG
jgi:hypothetical protein